MATQAQVDNFAQLYSSNAVVSGQPLATHVNRTAINRLTPATYVGRNAWTSNYLITVNSNVSTLDLNMDDERYVNIQSALMSAALRLKNAIRPAPGVFNTVYNIPGRGEFDIYNSMDGLPVWPEDIFRLVQFFPALEVGPNNGRIHMHIVVSIVHEKRFNWNLDFLRNFFAAFNFITVPGPPARQEAQYANPYVNVRVLRTNDNILRTLLGYIDSSIYATAGTYM